MKKRWILLLTIILVLSACGGATNNEPKDVSEKDSTTEELENKQEKSEDTDKEDKVDEEDQETTIEKPSGDVEDDQAVANENDSEDNSAANSNKEEGQKEKAEELAEQDILEYALSIFEAQVEEDYDYLESVLSEGSSVDKKNNTFQFDNVTYPHEYEFLPKKDLEFLDERYIKGEKDDDDIIVGFAVVDFNNESSYVIDMQFIKEDGTWKLNDIDVNK